VGERGVGDVQRALHVEGHHPLPLADRRVERWPEQHDSGIVDDGVEPAQFGNGLLDRGHRLLPHGYVGRQHERGPALVADRRRQFGQAVPTARHQGDGRSVGREPSRGRGANPAAGSGDEGDRVLERTSHQHLASVSVTV
jgi:hypothetical protein